MHIIAVKQLEPESFVLAPPAGFVIREGDVLIMLGKSGDINRMRALK